jgi:hypothetical protein
MSLLFELLAGIYKIEREHILKNEGRSVSF